MLFSSGMSEIVSHVDDSVVVEVPRIGATGSVATVCAFGWYAPPRIVDSLWL